MYYCIILKDMMSTFSLGTLCSPYLDAKTFVLLLKEHFECELRTFICGIT